MLLPRSLPVCIPSRSNKIFSKKKLKCVLLPSFLPTSRPWLFGQFLNLVFSIPTVPRHLGPLPLLPGLSHQLAKLHALILSLADRPTRRTPDEASSRKSSHCHSHDQNSTTAPWWLRIEFKSFSRLACMAFPDLASTDLGRLIFSLVTFAHTVARQQQISYCPLCPLEFHIPLSAFAQLPLDVDTLSPSPQVQCYPSVNIQLKCSLTCKAFLGHPGHNKAFFSSNVWFALSVSAHLSLSLHSFCPLCTEPL